MHKDRPERHTGRLMALWGGGDAVCSCHLATARQSKGEGMDAAAVQTAAKPSRPGYGGKERAVEGGDDSSPHAEQDKNEVNSWLLRA